MRYCSDCGSLIKQKIPPNDNRLRYVCTSCNKIYYQNPKPIVGCLPEWQDRLLLCRRAIEPRLGLWTLPAGFMEEHETVQAGAARETWEEAGAKVEIKQLYTMFNLPYISQIYLLFRAQLLDPNVAPGTESLEVNFFQEQDIPWMDIAFPVIRETLWLYFRDKKQGAFKLHTGDIVRIPGALRRYRINL